MKKWLLIGIAVAFAYLGTGYQFAVTNWDTYQKTKFEELNPAGGARLHHEALWPVTTEVAPKAASKIGLAMIVHFSETERKEYVWRTTLLWGPKLVWNVFWMVLAIPIIKLVVLLYYVAGSFLNFLLAPFGVHLTL